MRTWFGVGADKIEDAAARHAAMATDPRWAETAYLVEATDNERFAQWCFTAKDSTWRSTVGHRNDVEWVDTNPGYWETIGHLAKMPVAVTLTWAYLNGALVCFWEATSQVVDHRMIEKWLAKRFSNIRLKTNATNLHNVLGDIARRAK